MKKKKVGFIGLGHMASALIRALINSKSINAKDIIISNRSEDKLHQFKSDFPAVQIEIDNTIAAKKSEILFICVNTNEVVNVINQILREINDTKHIVIISGGLEISTVESLFKGSISKLIPTLTCEVFQGTSLLCHNKSVRNDDKKYLEEILFGIGQVKIIVEEQFVIYTALSSCAPGLISSIFDQFIKSATKYPNVDYKTSFEIILSSLLGTSLLLSKNNESFKDLVSRVARKGGNTELGVSIFKKQLPSIFNEVLERMVENESKRNTITRNQFKI